MSQRDWLSILGFILFLVGIVSLALGMVGVELSFLPLSRFLSPIGAAVVKVILFASGIALIYVSKFVVSDQK